ncbi:MAG TPA: hypothetical protein VF541_12215 [Longimicrobium sp.]|jgi:hypothetical protein
MAGELRLRAGEAEHAFPGPRAGSGGGVVQELVGATFTSPKDLRHLAEQLFGEDFVPTTVLAESAHFGVFALDAGEQGRVVVHAERGRHWFPFRVTRVQAEPVEEPAAEDPRRVPPVYIPTSRPKIDWL